MYNSAANLAVNGNWTLELTHQLEHLLPIVLKKGGGGVGGWWAGDILPFKNIFLFQVMSHVYRNVTQELYSQSKLGKLPNIIQLPLKLKFCKTIVIALKFKLNLSPFIKQYN